MEELNRNDKGRMRRRIVGYDVAKTLAMFFVVMLHYSFYTRYYSSGLAGTLVTTMCVVCVPLFFAVNGALLLPRPLDESRHYRKTLNIVVIVSVWKLLAAAFFVFVDGSHPITFKDLLIFLLGGSFGDYPTGYFWFMNALIAVYLVLPLAKMAFDSERRIVLRALLAVLFGFTVGKDTLALLLQMLGTAFHHDLASVLSSIDEYYIFGSYGYVLLYFLVGGLIGKWLSGQREDAHEPSVSITNSVVICGIVICYVVTVLIQQYQHAVNGTNLTVDKGYWLLPTFIAVVLILSALGKAQIRGFWARAFQVIGMNTFGVYMLHMAGLVLLSRFQGLGCFQVLSSMNSILVTIVNVVLCVCVFAVCLGVSVALRKVPYIRKLFSL